MERSIAMDPASAFIDEKVKELGDWRGKTLAKVRTIIHEADPEIVEEWKWAKAKSPGQGGRAERGCDQGGCARGGGPGVLQRAADTCRSASGGADCSVAAIARGSGVGTYEE